MPHCVRTSQLSLIITIATNNNNHLKSIYGDNCLLSGFINKSIRRESYDAETICPSRNYI